MKIRIDYSSESEFGSNYVDVEIDVPEDAEFTEITRLDEYDAPSDDLWPIPPRRQS